VSSEWLTNDQAGGALEFADGLLDGYAGAIGGWAYAGRPTPVVLHIYVNGYFHSQASANQPRDDLVEQGLLPDPEHGFRLQLRNLVPGANHIEVYGIDYPRQGQNGLIGSASTMIPGLDATGRISVDRGLTTEVLRQNAQLYIAFGGIWAEYFNHHCSFPSWSQFVDTMQRTDIVGVPERSDHFPHSTNDGVCPFVPSETFIIADNGIHQVGVTSYCSFESWDDFVNLTGRTAPDGIPTYSTLPTLSWARGCDEKLRISRVTMISNQLAANVYYKPPMKPAPPDEPEPEPEPEPEGKVVNGHFEDAYGDLGRWAQLRAKLKKVRGGIGTFAPTVGHLSSSFMEALKNEKIPLTIEDGSVTTQMPGIVGARAFFFGEDGTIDGKVSESDISDFLCKTLNLCGDPNRHDPLKGGLWINRDGQTIPPERIVLDHFGRFVGMDRCHFANEVIANTALGWDERREAACCNVIWNALNPTEEPRKSLFDWEDCEQFGKPGWVGSSGRGLEDLPNGLKTPAAEAAAIDGNQWVAELKRKWPDAHSTPSYSVHFLNNPYLEWRDEECINEKRKQPDGTAYDDFLELSFVHKPCYHAVSDLVALVTRLCQDEGCPEAVFFDTEWAWNLTWTMEMFRKAKAALRDLVLPGGRHVSIGFGITVVDPFDDIDLKTEPVSGSMAVFNRPLADNEGSGHVDRNKHPTDASGDPLPVNIASVNSVMAVMEALVANQILDDAVYVRYSSWTHRPLEPADQVNDQTPGSQPHTMSRIIDEYLMNRAF
jgi:hypothetical protein